VSPNNDFIPAVRAYIEVSLASVNILKSEMQAISLNFPVLHNYNLPARHLLRATIS